MKEIPQTLTIGVLADAAGVNVETIRFYQRKSLMQEPDRPLGGIRRYGDSDLARVHFIKSAQRLGFSLDEVADLLRLEDGSHCTKAREQAERKLADVRAQACRSSAYRSRTAGSCRALLRREWSGAVSADRGFASEVSG